MRFDSEQPSIHVDLEWSNLAVAVIVVTGEVGLGRVPRLRQALFQAADEGARQVVVDLSLAPFIDIATLGALVASAKRLGAQKGSLAVVCPVAEVRRTLQMGGLAGVLRICATRAEALSAMYRETAHAS